VIVTTAQYTVSTTSVKIVATNDVGRQVNIHCIGNDAVYLGPTSAVTTSTGFHLDKNAAVFQIELDANDELWAISATGSQTVTIMQVTL
jgi:hypothetical protein